VFLCDEDYVVNLDGSRLRSWLTDEVIKITLNEICVTIVWTLFLCSLFMCFMCALVDSGMLKRYMSQYALVHITSVSILSDVHHKYICALLHYMIYHVALCLHD